MRDFRKKMRTDETYESKIPIRRYLHTRRYDVVTNLLDGIENKKNKRVLDAGCAEGIYTPFLHKKFEKVVSCDLSEKNLGFIQKKLDGPLVIKCEVQHLPLKEHYFDVVLFSEVIEHLKSPELGLSECLRVLKNDGNIILSTPEKYSIYELSIKIAHFPIIRNIVELFLPLKDVGHISLMTSRDTKKLLRKLDLQILGEYKVGMYFPLAEFLGERIVTVFKETEKRINSTLFNRLLFTQIYLLSAPNEQES